MYKREDFQTIINLPISPPSALDEWVKLLNYFERYKDSLHIDEVRKLTDKCEQYRMCVNEDRHEEKHVTKNGHPHTVNVLKTGLGIEKQEVSPNLYQHLEQMENEQIVVFPIFHQLQSLFFRVAKKIVDIAYTMLYKRQTSN